MANVLSMLLSMLYCMQSPSLYFGLGDNLTMHHTQLLHLVNVLHLAVIIGIASCHCGVVLENTTIDKTISRVGHVVTLYT